MKKIAITQRLIETQGYFEWRECLDVRWGKLFLELDFVPVILPLEYDFKKMFKELHIEGLLLSGGNDLFQFSENDLSKKRDAFEKELLAFSISEKIPVLGVCRGMQLIGDYFGSTFTSVKGHAGTKHDLKINATSRYAHLLKQISTVNSYHNYAIKLPPESFLISATAQDDVIEAFEHKIEKILGVMWHSERVDPFDNNEIQLIKEFFND